MDSRDSPSRRKFLLYLWMLLNLRGREANRPGIFVKDDEQELGPGLWHNEHSRRKVNIFNVSVN